VVDVGDELDEDRDVGQPVDAGNGHDGDARGHRRAPADHAPAVADDGVELALRPRNDGPAVGRLVGLSLQDSA
jgi:hypothetical protein